MKQHGSLNVIENPEWHRAGFQKTVVLSDHVIYTGRTKALSKGQKPIVLPRPIRYALKNGKLEEVPPFIVVEGSC